MNFNPNWVNNAIINWYNENGEWLSGEADITGLAPGLYTVDIDNGCEQLTEEFEIIDCSESDLAIIEIIIDGSQWCVDGDPIIVSLEITGGLEPYNITWCDKDRFPNPLYHYHSNILKLKILSRYNYKRIVMVEDANGCKVFKEFQISSQDGTGQLEGPFSDGTACGGFTTCNGNEYPIPVYENIVFLDDEISCGAQLLCTSELADSPQVLIEAEGWIYQIEILGEFDGVCRAQLICEFGINGFPHYVIKDVTIPNCCSNPEEIRYIVPDPTPEQPCRSRAYCTFSHSVEDPFRYVNGFENVEEFACEYRSTCSYENTAPFADIDDVLIFVTEKECNMDCAVENYPFGLPIDLPEIASFNPEDPCTFTVHCSSTETFEIYTKTWEIKEEGILSNGRCYTTFLCDFSSEYPNLSAKNGHDYNGELSFKKTYSCNNNIPKGGHTSIAISNNRMKGKYLVNKLSYDANGNIILLETRHSNDYETTNFQKELKVVQPTSHRNSTSDNSEIYVIPQATDVYNDKVYIGLNYSGRLIDEERFNMKSVGNQSAAILKYDENSDIEWSLNLVGDDFVSLSSIVTDSQGRLYVLGSFTGHLYLNSNTVLESLENTSMFLAIYGERGRFISTEILREGILSSNMEMKMDINDQITIIANDVRGGIYTQVRNKKGIVSLDLAMPYVGDKLTRLASLPNGSYVCLLKGSRGVSTEREELFYFDNSGNKQWNIVLGTTSDEVEIASITSSSSTSFIIIGSFKGHITIGNERLESKGGYDIFIAKINSGGQVVWIKQEGAEGDEFGYKITTNGLGEYAYTGVFSSMKVDFSNSHYTNDEVGKFQTFVSGFNDGIEEEHGLKIELSEPIGKIVKKISIHPNPSNGLYHIVIPPTYKINKIQVVNILGRIVKEINLDQFSVPNGLTVDLKNMSDGIYFARFMDSDKIVSSNKIIKL